MKTLASWSTIVLLSVTCAFAAVDKAGDTNTVSKFQTTKRQYESAVAKIDGTLASKLQEALTAYGQGIDLALESLKKKGELDAFLLLQKEKNRFDLEKSVPETSGAPERAPDDRLVQGYKSAVDSAHSLHEEALLTLNKKYVVMLHAQVKELMLGDDLEQATNVNDEIKRVEAQMLIIQSKLTAAASKSAPAETDAKSSSPRLSSLKKGLVLYYPFDRDEGGKVADASGHMNNGEVRGAQWVSGVRSNGVGARANCGDDAHGDCGEARADLGDGTRLARADFSGMMRRTGRGRCGFGGMLRRGRRGIAEARLREPRPAV